MPAAGLEGVPADRPAADGDERRAAGGEDVLALVRVAAPGRAEALDGVQADRVRALDRERVAEQQEPAGDRSTRAGGVDLPRARRGAALRAAVTTPPETALTRNA